MTGITRLAKRSFVDRAGPGADIDAVLARFDRLQAAADQLGVSNYLVRLDGMCFIVRSGTIVSVQSDLDERCRASALAGPRVAEAAE